MPVPVEQGVSVAELFLYGCSGVIGTVVIAYFSKVLSEAGVFNEMSWRRQERKVAARDRRRVRNAIGTQQDILHKIETTGEVRSEDIDALARASEREKKFKP